MPVIFVCLGTIPDFLLLNIEMSARNNHVIVLVSENVEELTSYYPFDQDLFNVTFTLIQDYSHSAKEFVPHYKHMV